MSAALTTEATTKADEGIGTAVPQWDVPSLVCQTQKHVLNTDLAGA